MREELARLSKSTLIYGVGGVLNRFISFLFLPVFTSYLSPADYGISSILGLLTFVATSVFSLGLGAGIGPSYFEGNNREQKERTIWTAFVLLIASALILGAFGLVFASHLSIVAFQTPQYGYLVTLTLLSTALNILTIPFTLRLQFEGWAAKFVTLTAVSTLSSISVSLFMVVILQRGIQGLIEGGLIVQVVNLFLFLAPTAPGLKFRLSRTLGKELLRLGVPLVPSFAFLFVLQQGNKYILQWFRGLDEVGIYAVGFNFGMVMNLVVSAFQNAWYPYFMSFMDKPDEGRRLFGRIFTYYVFGFGALSLLFYLAARPVVMLMTQPAFHEAYKVVGLSATAQFLIGVFSLLLPGVFFAKEVRYISGVQGIAAVASLALNLLLVPAFGLQGAGIALALGLLTMAVLQHCWNLRRGYLPVQYEWLRVGLFALVYTVYAALALWDYDFSRVGAVLLFGGLAGLLPFCLYPLLDSHEKQALRRFIRGMRPMLYDWISLRS